MAVSMGLAAEIISHGFYVLGQITTEAIRRYGSINQDVTAARLIALRSDFARYRFITLDGFFENDIPRVLDDLAQDLASLQRKNLDLYKLLCRALPGGSNLDVGATSALAPLPIGGWEVWHDGKLNSLPLLASCAITGYQAGIIRYSETDPTVSECLRDVLQLYWRMAHNRELVTSISELGPLLLALKQARPIGIYPTVLIAGAFSKSIAAQSRRCMEIDYTESVDTRYQLKRIR